MVGRAASHILQRRWAELRVTTVSMWLLCRHYPLYASLARATSSEFSSSPFSSPNAERRADTNVSSSWTNGLLNTASMFSVLFTSSLILVFCFGFGFGFGYCEQLAHEIVSSGV
jgi:hypothetical protein